ncbi:hypothetical protein F5148DRAFT_1175898 [Russula earlei]|uniref:Uncharacterized protein n=1 Tax=Russula earlei TaxID=71964 RepID=A0ACC0UHC2_9AGAM|nr:hypothetical protein F5148DRAFT_1175898 [Russula earlei]
MMRRMYSHSGPDFVDSEAILLSSVPNHFIVRYRLPTNFLNFLRFRLVPSSTTSTTFIQIPHSTYNSQCEPPMFLPYYASPLASLHHFRFLKSTPTSSSSLSPLKLTLPRRFLNFGFNQNPEGALLSSSDSNHVEPKEDLPSTSPHITARGLTQEERNAIHHNQNDLQDWIKTNMARAQILKCFRHTLDNVKKEEAISHTHLVKPEPKSTSLRAKLLSPWTRKKGKM